MKILVACEFSGVIRDAFRRLGHDAYSCDILESETPSEFHYKCDVREILSLTWDMIIAHPPCTYLCNSGVHWLHRDESRWDKMEEACRFFNLFKRSAPKVLIENPIPHKYAREHIGKYTQIIQPWQFGHPESKATCLWLENLPLLQPTLILEKPSCGFWDNQTPSGQNKLGPSQDRAKLRSKTYQGIGEAIASQYGGLV